MHKHLILAIALLCSAPFSSANPEPRPPGVHGHQCRTWVMDADDFSTLYTIVKNQSFKDRQMEFIKVGALGTSFSPAQCLSLMNLFSFDDDKLQVLEILSPRMASCGEEVEPLLDAFSFPSSKEKACKILLRR